MLVQQAAQRGEGHGHGVLAVPHKGQPLLAQADRVLAGGHAIVLLKVFVPHLRDARGRARGGGGSKQGASRLHRPRARKRAITLGWRRRSLQIPNVLARSWWCCPAGRVPMPAVTPATSLVLKPLQSAARRRRRCRQLC